MAFTKLKNKKSKISLIIVAILLILILAAFITIKCINNGYEYDTYGSENILEDGEQGNAIIYYNGSDGMPESSSFTFTAGEPIELPTVTRQGYHFIGWERFGVIIHNNQYVYADNVSFKALFSKDYSNIKTPVAIFTDEFNFTEYNVGEYEKTDIKDSEIFVDGGYKVYLYTKENFEGEEKIVSYTQTVDGDYKSMKIEAFETQAIKTGDLSDDDKAELLYTFAPRIWWAEDEEYFPTTINNALNNLEKATTDNGNTLILTELDRPDYKNDYLYGNLESAKSYAFATEKDSKYLDLSYFVFTPYNLGKTVLGMEFGNHIGDWEHITVRLMREEINGETVWRPITLCCCAHSLENYYSWDDVETIDGTHPVVYTAKGSHGMWTDAGANVYEDLTVIKLTDNCSQGTAWDLWLENRLETYSYDSISHSGYGIGNSEWETSFDTDYYNTESGAIAKWGNKTWEPPICIFPQLSGSPSGPQSKLALKDYYILN